MKKAILIFTIFIFLVLILIGINSIAFAAENIIKVGVMGPLKFGAGIGTVGGAEIAAEEINKQGGYR